MPVDEVVVVAAVAAEVTHLVAEVVVDAVITDVAVAVVVEERDEQAPVARDEPREVQRERVEAATTTAAPALLRPST